MNDLTIYTSSGMTDNTTMNMSLPDLNESISNISVNMSPMGPDIENHIQTIKDITPIFVFTFGILGFIANILSIIATLHIPRGLTTHSKLIISLGVSDILIIFGSSTYYVSDSQTQIPCVELIKKMILDTALCATLINLFSMAVDHYIAILKPMKYQILMSKNRGNFLVIMTWLISILGGLLELFVGLIHFPKGEYACKPTEFDFELCILGFNLIVLVAILIIYLHIYVIVRKLMEQDSSLCRDAVHGYKATITTFLIIGTFIICWLPNCLFQIIAYVISHTDDQFLIDNFKVIITLHHTLYILLLCNSLCDPIIYAVRLSKVKAGYRQLLYKLKPTYRQTMNEDDFRNMHMKHNQRRSTIATLLNENTFRSDSVRRMSDSENSPRLSISLSETTEKLILQQNEAGEELSLNNNSDNSKSKD